MKKILICLLTFSFFLDAQQSVNAVHSRHQQEVPKEQEAYNNGKPLEYEIDLQEYQGDKCSLSSEFPSHIATSITAKVKKIGSKIMPALPYVIPATLFLGYQWYTSDPEIGFSITEASNSAYALLGGSFLVPTVFGKQILKGFSNLQQKTFPISWQSDDFAKILTYKKIIDERFQKKQITEETKDVFYAELGFYNYLAAVGAEGVSEGKKCIKNMQTISLLPIEVKKWDWAIIATKIEELIKAYPRDIQDEILRVMREIVTNSTYRNPEKTIICFYGPPGTGKTRLAKEIANILDLSIKIFKSSSSGAEKMIAQNIKKGGKEIMLESFSKEKNNHKNNILFIDEVDRCLNGSQENKKLFIDFFLHICNLDDVIYESGKIEELGIDMSAAIIIMACNNLPEDFALKSRIKTDVIHIKEIPEDKQREIAYESFIKEIKNAQLSHVFLLEDETIEGKIKQEHKEILDEIFEKNILPNVDDVILKNNRNPGVRELTKIVKKYVKHLAGRYNCPYERLDQYPFDVDKAYKNCEEKEEVKKKDEPDTQMMMNAIICDLYAEHLKKINSKKEDELGLNVMPQDKDKIEIQNQSNFNDINDDANRDS
ncbi:MAG: ATP-binding protein [Alphaproteobacteria bacterium]|nr:ATP-binding protein [Alphaproteobacteria bacterium]